MADLELVDALTDNPPEIEPEVKRDFISSLEAEAFDDVIGEKCDKTDYVPLLDGDEANGSGNKRSAEGSHPSVLENGEHNTGDGGSDPFGSPGNEVSADFLLPPEVQICPAFTAQLPESSADFEGWLTDSYSKSGDTGTPSTDASEKTTATFGETPSDESANLPFQVSESDPNSHIWQPTAAEQIALSVHNAPEHEGLQLNSEESPFDSGLSTESQLLPGLRRPYLEQHDTDLLKPDPYNQDIASASTEYPDPTTENYVHESLNSPTAEDRLDEEDIDTERVTPASPTSVEPPQSPTAQVSAEPPLLPVELIQENSLVKPFSAEIHAEPLTSLDELVHYEESPASPAALSQETESPASPAELVQEAEPLTTPIALTQEAEAPTSPVDLVQEVSSSPIALVQEVELLTSPVPLVQEVDPSASTAALVHEVEVPVSPVALVQVAEVPASPIALVQEAEPPAFPVTLVQKVDAPASPVALVQDIEFPVSLATLSQELEIPSDALTPLFIEGNPPPEGPPEQFEIPLGRDGLQHPADQGKSDSAAVPEEAKTSSDITAPPTKELPASPEKKATAASSKSAATPRGKPLTAPSPKKPVSSTLAQPKKAISPSPATTNAATPKRPLGSTVKTPKDTKEAKPKDLKSPVKSPDKKPLTSATTPRSTVKASPVTSKLNTSAAANTTGTSAPKPNLTPKRPTSLKNDLKAAETKKTISTKSPTESSRPKSSPAEPTKNNGTTATSPGRLKTSKPAVSKTLPGPSASADAKKQPAARPAPVSKTTTATASKPASALTASKPTAAPKQPRPATAPNLKNVRSKIGSTDNLKHQPGGGKQAKVEKKPVPASTARKPVPAPAATKTASTKPADPKETTQKQSNGKVTNPAKPSVGSSRPPASTSHKPGGANVQILNKKLDVSKVSSKCGSKPNVKAKSGGDAKSEDSLKTETTKQKPEESIKENSEEQIAQPQNGDLATPTDNTAVDTRENGVGEMLPVDGSNQREIQSFNSLIPETSI